MQKPSDLDIDPIALFEALRALRGEETDAVMGQVDALLAITARYFRGEGPNEIGSPENPLKEVRRRVILVTRRWTVEALFAWKKDILSYDQLPGAAIDQWFSGSLAWPLKGPDAVFNAAAGVLEDTDFKASVNQLKAAYYPKGRPVPGLPSEEACAFFGIPHPASVFREPTVPMPQTVKERLEQALASKQVPAKKYMRSTEKQRALKEILPPDHPLKS